MVASGRGRFRCVRQRQRKLRTCTLTREGATAKSNDNGGSFRPVRRRWRELHMKATEEAKRVARTLCEALKPRLTQEPKCLLKSLEYSKF
ncbi:hypothetical protein B296_00038182 [Ensete ventricosum]|uniref:Uncharacterized protein n=1 Tax=Ensete ventricosum TaxID=4639 RepID=A0A426Z9T9_ENSVE|nr:hypothetical protein B296_00038182 [Ensete ventricosum]